MRKIMCLYFGKKILSLALINLYCDYCKNKFERGIMGNKLFGTDGVRGVANVYPMTADFAMKLGKACAEIVCTKTRRAAIGKDTRISGDMLEAALAAGFTSMGIDVVRLGVLPTPAVTTVTPELGVDMAVMITASHNPYKDNGIKLIAADGEKFSDAVTAELEEKVNVDDFAAGPDKIGRISDDDSAIEKYVKIAKSTAKGNNPLKGLKVVLDCANGVFSEIMPRVYKELGADVIVMANQPDGLNINRDCGSMHPQKMMEKVKEVKADLGIAVDGDGDRIIVCDDKGEKVNSEQIIGFLAQYMDSIGQLNGRAVVSTILSNTALERFVKEKGIPYYSTPVGERHVVAKMKETGGAVGGEESGHVVALDYCKSGDALVVSLILSEGLLKSGKKMSEIFPIFAMDPFEFVSPRFESREQVKALVKHESILKLLESLNQEMNGEGRIVIHPSGTEPLIRIWVSGKNAGKVKKIHTTLVEAFEKLR